MMKPFDNFVKPKNAGQRKLLRRFFQPWARSTSVFLENSRFCAQDLLGLREENRSWASKISLFLHEKNSFLIFNFGKLWQNAIKTTMPAPNNFVNFQKCWRTKIASSIRPKIGWSPVLRFQKKWFFCIGLARQGKSYFKGKIRFHCHALFLRVFTTFRPTMSSSQPMARHRKKKLKLQTEKNRKSRHERREASRNSPPGRRSGAANLDQRTQTQGIFQEPRANAKNLFDQPKTWNAHVKSSLLRLL